MVRTIILFPDQATSPNGTRTLRCWIKHIGLTTPGVIRPQPKPAFFQRPTMYDSSPATPIPASPKPTRQRRPQADLLAGGERGKAAGAGFRDAQTGQRFGQHHGAA